MHQKLEKLFNQFWYENPRGAWLWWLLWWPWTRAYATVMAIRRFLYQKNFLKSEKLPVKTIVVGNLTVGGTGKTPLTLWLAEKLSQKNHKIGIISRGYGGTLRTATEVNVSQHAPHEVGDEPFLLAQKSHVPVAIAPKRLDAGKLLLKNHPDIQILICDDGLQHLALQRDMEIVVVDGARFFGNGQLLPMGPLREPTTRVRDADMLIVNGGDGEWALKMRLVITTVRAMSDGVTRQISHFRGKTVHAVAGIGNPTRFFDQLRQAGLTVIEHAFADHAHYVQSDFAFEDLGENYPILMTEKDAVKCVDFADSRFWAVGVTAELEAEAEGLLWQKLVK